MKILHIVPHLGGGVGKAHAALCAAMPDDVEQVFLLLEEPRDRRHVDAVLASGAAVRVARSLDDVARRAAAADIVQFEFWNHPRLFECLARTAFPAMRTVFWSHVSGLFNPVIPPGLIAGADRFVFTTEASLALADPSALRRGTVTAINSGFGFTDAPARPQRSQPKAAYLGTVDFVKMHPGFFDVVDGLEHDVEVAIWGAPSVHVMAAALHMRSPQRVRFHGHTDRPQEALAAADIFFYPLQPDHYGTAENALIEAMSLGLVPVVLDNPAEAAIVRHNETGLIARSIDECTALLQGLLGSKEERERLSRNAAAAVANSRNPERSAEAFLNLWRVLLDEAPRVPEFGAAVGGTPAEWYLSTQLRPGDTWSPPIAPDPQTSKGTLAHFEHVFDGDASLAGLKA